MRHNGFSLFVSVARTSSLRLPATSEVVNPPYKAVKAVLFSISKLERQLWNHSHPWFTCNEENDTDTAGPERLNYTGVFLYLVPTFLCQASWGRCVIGRVAVLWQICSGASNDASETKQTFRGCLIINSGFYSVTFVFSSEQNTASHTQKKIPFPSHPATGTILNFI